MPDSFEEIASRPSIIRSHWLPLEAAVQEVVAFEKRFGEAHLLLACHAALPALLTPELLHFIRLNFLDQQHPRTPWISEMDLLLSPLCRPIDEELFEVEPMIREALLFELQERYGWSRLQELSQFLLEYLQKQPQHSRNADPARLYEWIAQSYLQPDKVIGELQHILQESLDPQLDARQTLPKKLQLARTMELLAEPLEHTTRPSDYHGLIHSARVVSHVIYTNQESIATTPLSSSPVSSKQSGTFFPPAVQQWLQTLTTVQDAPEHTNNVIDDKLENVKGEIKEEEKQVLHMLETVGWHLQEPAYIDTSATAYIMVRKAPWSMLPSVDIPLFTSLQDSPIVNKFAKAAQTYMLIINSEIVGTASIMQQNTVENEIEDPRDNTSYNYTQIIFRRNFSPFTYEVNGSDILFTNELEPEAQNRHIAYFHRPETLEAWLQQAPIDTPNDLNNLLRSRLRHMPAMSQKEWRTHAQWEAATALEKSLAENQPRVLISMTDGMGKTSLLIQTAYRLLTFANARHILYLTNEKTEQAIYARFEQFRVPGTTELFTERFSIHYSKPFIIDMPFPNVQVLITSIEELYANTLAAVSLSIIHDKQDDKMRPMLEQRLREAIETLSKSGRAVYNSEIPIEAFDFILIDDYDSTTYAQWRPVLDYFDAFIIATTNHADNQDLSFFNNNLVYDYKTTSPKGNTQWQPLLKPAFWQALAKLPAQDIQLVVEKITLLTQDPLPDGKLKKQINHLPGRPYRIRAGSYRIFYNFNQQYIVLFKIEHRSETTYQGYDTAEDGSDSIEPAAIADWLWSYSEVWAPSEVKTQWSPLLKQEFLQDIAKLPAQDIQLIMDKITLLTQNPSLDGNLQKQLNQHPDKLYKVRTSSYRIFYTFNQKYILFFKIEHRDEATYQDPIMLEEVPNSTELNALTDQLQPYEGIRGQEGIYLGDYLEQLTYLIFLKIEQERSYLSGKRSTHVPIGYDWQSLLDKSGSALTEHYTNILNALSVTQGITGVIFENADDSFRNPAHLHSLITDYINEENWLSMDSQTRGNVYSSLLVKMAQGKDGPYNNVPDALASTIVEVMHPKPGMTIGDPACATASLLVEAHTYMTHQTSDPDSMKNALYGYDISTQIASLAAMNLWMHDCEPVDGSCPIIVKDSLRTPADRRFDMVLSRLPYRVTHLERLLRRADFVTQTSNIQLNFLQHIVSMLRDNGYAAVIVLDETLIEGGAGKQIRADLLETCEVHTLLRLPVGTFYTLANVLFFDSKLHEIDTYETSKKDLWVYDLRTNMDLRKIPLTREHFADFVQCYNPQNRLQRTETQRFHKFSYEELIQRKNVNLDISWLLDDTTPSASQATRNAARSLQRKFNTWLEEQQKIRERPFTDEQISWLKRIRDHIATHGHFTLLDLERIPFKTEGGRATAQALFGTELLTILDELNQVLGRES